MSRRLWTALAVLSLTVAVTACGGSGGGGASPAPGKGLSSDTPKPKGDIDSFTWASYAEPPTLDYVHAFDYPQNMVLSNVCESLMRWTPELKEEPGLAEKAVQRDPKTLVYTIRAGVRFHSGAEMTADDVVASLNRHLDEKVGSYWISSFRNVESISKTGPMEVTVKFKQPDALFNLEMGASPGTVVSAASLKAKGRAFGTADGGLDCTGPFKLGTWTKGQSIQLDRFDGYWGNKARSGKVTFTFVADPAARTNAMVTGEADGGYMIPAGSIARLRASGAGTVYGGPNLTTANLIVSDLANGPLADVRVRQALSLAIDRQGLVKAALGEYSAPTLVPGPVQSWRNAVDARPAAPAIKRDVEAAKKLIAEAGAQGKKIVIATSGVASEFPVISNSVQAAAKEIGLAAEVRTVAPDAYTALFSDPEARKGIDLFPTFWYLSATDPLELYGLFETGQFENYGGFSDPAYDKLVQAAEVEFDRVKRARLTAKLQETVATQLPWIPLADLDNVMFLGKRITGAPTSISYLYYPWAADIGAAG
ncbi:ABC transporter substrate-binding protein [Nonomuraea sp. bgisy101]|uniref:ABC transporter substrate-binding protein n=1 Tax=Nonomuraea sp. bgisy101 TaxID=3413784 RepID=UPI003D75317D